MRVRILYFQNVKLRAGTPEEFMEVPEGATVAELTEKIVAAHPEIGPIARSLLFAVNEEQVGQSHLLTDGDTLALMPPFSGG